MIKLSNIMLAQAPYSPLRRLQQLALSLMLLLPISVSADPQQLLQDLQKMRLSATDVVTNFYMFTGLDADSKYDRRMQKSKASFDSALAAAKGVAADNQVGEHIANIESDWQLLSELIDTNRNDMMKQGFPNVRLVDEMGRASQDIVKKVTMVYGQVQQTSGIAPNKIVQQTRALALLMEEITSQYAARGTTNLGQVFVGNHDMSLTDMADMFDTKLKQLKADLSAQNNASATTQIVKSIDSKWKFMVRSIKNYNENTVPFLVVSYNDRIIMHLQEVEALYR